MENLSIDKKQFIETALSVGALKWGSFTLKSGRMSPYFFNAGAFCSGNAISILGNHYATAILENIKTIEHLYGPAYKGIPIATATAIALSQKNINVSLSFNRKEAKQHGEGGTLMGSDIKGKLIMIDDVITAGTAFRESKQIIEANGGKLDAVVVALDRCEKSQDQTSTLESIRKLGITVASVINFYDLVAYLRLSNHHHLDKMVEYHKQYGAL